MGDLSKKILDILNENSGIEAPDYFEYQPEKTGNTAVRVSNKSKTSTYRITTTPLLIGLYFLCLDRHNYPRPDFEGRITLSVDQSQLRIISVMTPIGYHAKDNILVSLLLN